MTRRKPFEIYRDSVSDRTQYPGELPIDISIAIAKLETELAEQFRKLLINFSFSIEFDVEVSDQIRGTVTIRNETGIGSRTFYIPATSRSISTEICLEYFRHAFADLVNTIFRRGLIPIRHD
jgi:hypothetical protein